MPEYLPWYAETVLRCATPSSSATPLCVNEALGVQTLRHVARLQPLTSSKTDGPRTLERTLEGERYSTVGSAPRRPSCTQGYAFLNSPEGPGSASINSTRSPRVLTG
jgi:hypothetical protein